MASKICPPANFKLKYFFERSSANFKLEIVLRIHETKANKQGELRNYLTKILELTHIIVEIDVKIEGLFATFNPSASMHESIPLDPIATLTTTKQKPKKIDIIRKKNRIFNFLQCLGLKKFFMLVGTC
jgi:hypothetical protein